MNKPLRINEVAQNYNITKRTIRYYEEIGLLTNIKKDNSNYRYYDEETLNRLEQILLLRSLNFHISEISKILLSEDDESINKILHDKLIKLKEDINSYISLKNIITSIIRIKDTQGMKNVNFYQILKEQIYVHKKIERVFEMNQFSGDMIIIEFGVNIVECANAIIENIKNLRQDVQSKFAKDIPLIRIRDNSNLKEDEYKIIVKGITVKQGFLENVNNNEKVITIINELKESVMNNLQSIAE